VKRRGNFAFISMPFSRSGLPEKKSTKGTSFTRDAEGVAINYLGNLKKKWKIGSGNVL